MRSILKRFNVLDYLVFLIILFSVLVYFLLFKRQADTILIDVFTPSASWSDTEFQPQLYWQTQKLTQGLTMYNSLGSQVAQITEISRIPWGNGTQEYVLMSLKVKAFYNTSTHTYTFNSKPLLIGGDFEIEAQNTLLKGQILGIYKNESERNAHLKMRTAKVTVRFRYQDPWIADKFKGAEIRDNNQVLVKNLTATISPTIDTAINWQGQLVKTVNPYKDDVLATFEVHDINCTETMCFFNRYIPLSIGRNFPVDFVNFTFNPDTKILDIQYID